MERRERGMVLVKETRYGFSVNPGGRKPRRQITCHGSGRSEGTEYLKAYESERRMASWLEVENIIS